MKDEDTVKEYSSKLLEAEEAFPEWMRKSFHPTLEGFDNRLLVRMLVDPLFELDHYRSGWPIRDTIDQREFNLSCVFGPPYLSERPRFWEQLSVFSGKVTHPWILVGDINQVLRPSEKLSANTNIPGAEDF
ncbi:putative non-LTR retroelement reverse transcriptase [Senna tora]|uniref:Putative non-LTR retroelement reverse transcriptase n=1 Tax=Senna tora TaxID=362788 RepID=A0A834X6F9_9FABA|nr:putative non-LTR retroelement reverse transcriptase [Senna tora]